MDDEPLIHRDEVTAALFAIADVNANVRAIRGILEEGEDDGEEEEE
jgi:hypothetical protein